MDWWDWWSYNPKFRDLGIKIAFLFGVSSIKYVDVTIYN